MCVAVCACVCGNMLQERLISPSPKSQVMFAAAHSHESVIFAYFCHSYFLRYGHFVEHMNMHAMN